MIKVKKCALRRKSIWKVENQRKEEEYGMLREGWVEGKVILKRGPEELESSPVSMRHAEDVERNRTVLREMALNL